MSKRVLLVNPPFYAFLEYDRWWFAHSCAQLAACLRERNIEAFVYDADKYFRKDPLTRDREVMVRRQSWYREGVDNDDHPVWRHFRKTLADVRPDIVGVAAWSSFLPSCVKVLSLCREFDPSIKTCIGGYHATALPGAFRGDPLVDAVFVGPADRSLPEWVLGGCREALITTDPRSVDVKQLPFPDREALLYPEHFTAADMGMIMTSRGCPSNCSFCSNKLLTGLHYQFRTVEQVRAELDEIIGTYGVTHLNVADANLLANRRSALDMAGLFKTFGIAWGAEGLITSITEDLLSRLIDCGCDNLSFGIESGSQQRLDKLNKRVTLEQIERASVLLNRSGITWKAFFIVGFPDETPEEMEQTRRFALKIRPSYISLNSFTPLPGTDIAVPWADSFSNAWAAGFANQLNPGGAFRRSMDAVAYEEAFLSMLREFEAYNREAAAVDVFKGR